MECVDKRQADLLLYQDFFGGCDEHAVAQTFYSIQRIFPVDNDAITVLLGLHSQGEFVNV